MLDGAARAAYSAAYGARCETSGGLGSMDAGLDGAALFEVVIGGAVVGRYALRLVDRPNGRELVIVAAAGGAPGFDLVASILPHVVDKQSQGADRITVRTRRRGLVKKLLARGWSVDAYVLGKSTK